MHWFPSWLDPYPCSFDPFWFLWKWGTPYKSLVQRHFAHEQWYFLRVPHFQTQATSSVQYPLSSHHTGWWSGLWPVIICSMFSLGWSKNPITKIAGKLNTHRPFYAQMCTGHPSLWIFTPGRRLGSWGSGANGWSLCWEILLNKKLDSNFTTACWNSRTLFAEKSDFRFFAENYFC